VLPNLKGSKAAASDDATAVVQKSTQAPATNKDELISMTNLLIDYVGPIAKNIMVAHDNANTPANELATVISREIPRPEERKEFLKRWELLSGTRIDATRISIADTRTPATEVQSFDEKMLREIGEDYAAYIGPLAARLVKHHASTTASLEQLVESLASEIPDDGDSEKFKNQWLRN
jgi:hypothetical protein